MSDDSFSLNLADVDEIKKEVQPEPPLPEAQQKIKEQAEKNAAAILAECDDPLSDKADRMKSMMDAFGKESMVQTSNNQLMQISAGQLAKAGQGGDEVGKTLMNLRNEIETLDPKGVDFSGKGFLRLFSNPIKKYFAKYQKSENVIAGIVDSLDDGKKTLLKDNISLKNEQQALRETTRRLKTDIELGMAMDTAIENKLLEAEAAAQSPGANTEQLQNKIKFIKEEILFPLRQKITDMQQLQVVSQQGFIAMEVLQRNNNELVRGVDRAKTVTVSALRTAITIASALYNQRITLEKIKALNETTGNLIAQTSRMLKEQGAEIHQQAASSTLNIDQLRTSFADVTAALDAIETFKTNALPTMKSNIEEFQKLAKDGEARIQRLEKGSTLAAGTRQALTR
ncbi:MAG: toxic anion resistance protein [Deltaproteobacteria bacterium]|jgi:uncharacterized protein YaaN involved in tellurite resistance|nr:toxic anion resistance protein [Deltaproteobacteria bacterium]